MQAREIVELGRYPYSGWLGGLTGRDHEVVSWAIDAVGATHLAGNRGTATVRGEGLPAAMARAVLEREGFELVTEPANRDSLSLTVSEAGWHLSAEPADISGDTFRSLAAHLRRVSGVTTKGRTDE